MDVNLITVTIPLGPDGYGINFRGSSPVIIDTVLPGSTAEKGGLKYGDFMIELNENDIQSFSKEAVIAVIRSSNKGSLKIRVARVRPIPMTAEDRKRALQVVQNKIMSGSGSRNSTEIVQYQETVRSSLLEVEDLLGSFDLPPLTQPPAAKTTPTKTTPTKSPAKQKSGKPGEYFEEVEVPLYDSDSLPSPPSSDSSEADPKDGDKLLDFSRDDDLTYNPGSGKKVADFTQEGFEGPRMMKAMWQAQHGIEGMKEILTDVKEKKQRKMQQKGVTMVSTSATFTPGLGPSSSGHAPSSSSGHAPSSSSGHAPSSSSGHTPSSRPTPHAAQPTSPKYPIPAAKYPLPSSPSSAPSGSSSSINRSGRPSSQGTSPITSPITTTHPVTTPLSPTKSPGISATTSVPVRPHPLAANRQQPETARNALWKQTTPTTTPSGAFVPPTRHTPQNHTPTSPVARSPPMVGPRVNEGASTAMPPPVPPYNPTQPDRFPLSNKQEYRMEYKQQTHSYDEVNREEVRNIQRGMASGGVTTPLSPPSTTAPTGDVPIRRKKQRQGIVAALPNEEGAGYVGEGVSGMGGSGRLEIGRLQARGDAEVAEMPITDLTSVEVACEGLPISVYDWSHHEVHQWLKQLSPSLYKLYKPNFVKHEIIGRSLLRLNINKVKTMGITSVRHGRALVMEINRLKVRQEKLELEELQNESQLSYL